MTCKFSRCVAALVVSLAGLGANPARADFYSLAGRFACLENAAATCVDMGRLAEKRQIEKPAEGSDAKPIATPAAPAGDKPIVQAPALTSIAAPDPLPEITARIKTGTASSEDLRRLRVVSRTGDGRAIELLAWCDYSGIGLPRDPVAAYILYGIAALAGVSGARTNQAVIYDYDLSSDQRQIVLDIANDQEFATTR